MVVKAPKPPSVEEVAQAQLDPRGVAQRLVPLAAGAQLGGDAGSVSSYSATSASTSRVGDRVDGGDQVVDAVGVDRDAEAQLRLDLVALGHRDVAHVVAEAGQPQRPQLARSPSAARAQAPIRAATAGSLTCPATVLRATPSRVWM